MDHSPQRENLASLFARVMPAPPQTLPLRQAARILASPYLGGVIIAFFAVTRFWPAGFDAQLYYLRTPPDNATTPAWVYLFTYPLSWLGWPLSWQVLATATIIVLAVFYAMRGNRRWWVVVFSAPSLYNAWWGQIEILSILGLAIALLALQKKLSPAWLGLTWLMLAIKPQINYGLILVLLLWCWHALGWRALLPGFSISLLLFGLTLMLWPGWIPRLIDVYRHTQLGLSKASVCPYGLLAWPLALLPVPMAPERRLRMVCAASLMGTPYFTLHHCVTLMALTDVPWALVLTWLPMVMIGYTRDWAMYAGVIPAGIFLYDLYQLYVSRSAKPDLPVRSA